MMMREGVHILHLPFARGGCSRARACHLSVRQSLEMIAILGQGQ